MSMSMTQFALESEHQPEGKYPEACSVHANFHKTSTTAAFLNFSRPKSAFCHCEISLESHGDLETILMPVVDFVRFSYRSDACPSRVLTFSHCPRHQQQEMIQECHMENLLGLQ